MQIKISKNQNILFIKSNSFINYQLKKNGIINVYNINKNTYSDKENFFSYRRLTHQNKINSGRMINIISLID